MRRTVILVVVLMYLSTAGASLAVNATITDPVLDATSGEAGVITIHARNDGNRTVRVELGYSSYHIGWFDPLRMAAPAVGPGETVSFRFIVAPGPHAPAGTSQLEVTAYALGAGTGTGGGRFAVPSIVAEATTTVNLTIHQSRPVVIEGVALETPVVPSNGTGMMVQLRRLRPLDEVRTPLRLMVTGRGTVDRINASELEWRYHQIEARLRPPEGKIRHHTIALLDATGRLLDSQGIRLFPDDTDSLVGRGWPELVTARLAAGRLVLRYAVTNTGTTELFPRLYLELVNATGSTICSPGSSLFTLGPTEPGVRVQGDLITDCSPPPGTYRLRGRIGYDGTVAVDRFTVQPDGRIRVHDPSCVLGCPAGTRIFMTATR